MDTYSLAVEVQQDLLADGLVCEGEIYGDCVEHLVCWRLMDSAVAGDAVPFLRALVERDHEPRARVDA